MTTSATKRSRGPRRLSPTTIVLVLVLLGAVAGASRLVTPPPPGPPAEVKPVPATTTTTDKMHMMQYQEQMKNERAMQEAHKPHPVGNMQPVPDPATLTIDSSYFLKTAPGEKGLKQVEAQQKRDKAAYDEYRRRVAAAQGKGAAAPNSPVAVPAK